MGNSFPRHTVPRGNDRKLFSEESLRAMLAILVAVLLLLSLILFGITNNPALIVGSTVIGIPASAVYAYYFRRRR